MERLNGLNKTECVRTTIFHDGPCKAIVDVEYATAGWVDWRNNRRFHARLGIVSPNEFEQTYNAALTREPPPHRSGKEPASVHLARWARLARIVVDRVLDISSSRSSS